MAHKHCHDLEKKQSIFNFDAFINNHLWAVLVVFVLFIIGYTKLNEQVTLQNDTLKDILNDVKELRMANHQKDIDIELLKIKCGIQNVKGVSTSSAELTTQTR